MEWWSSNELASHDEDEDDDWFSMDSVEKDTDKDKVKNSCNQISESSDWSLFHPGVTKTETLSVFADDMCRNLKFSFDKEVNIGGVIGYRFTMSQKEYGDSRKVPENSCYCSHPGEGREDCPKDGAYQINACQKGASVLISHPHFYHGDPSYVSDAGGVAPKQDKHESFIDIEPVRRSMTLFLSKVSLILSDLITTSFQVTGQVLRYSKKNQVNLHLRPLKSIADFNHVPNMIFPVMWTDEVLDKVISGKISTQKKYNPAINRFGLKIYNTQIFLI